MIPVGMGEDDYIRGKGVLGIERPNETPGLFLRGNAGKIVKYWPITRTRFN